ncbi:hypothetical protein DXG01_012580 [Tephrocybe rancida]|nr:hypothetical protein DXG01_012580 [Tephrocybe rancida]
MPVAMTVAPNQIKGRVRWVKTTPHRASQVDPVWQDTDFARIVVVSVGPDDLATKNQVWIGKELLVYSEDAGMIHIYVAHTQSGWMRINVF